MDMIFFRIENKKEKKFKEIPRDSRGLWICVFSRAQEGN